MKTILLSFICLFSFTVGTYAQTDSFKTKETQRYIIKVAPTINFNFATSKKARSHNYYPSNFNTGLNINFLLKNKTNNYHDFGAIIQFLPNTNKRLASKTFYGNRIGIEYSYRIVKYAKKKSNFGFFTAFGTQLLFTKMEGQSLDYPTKTTRRIIEQNITVTPGIQYSKNKFFLDFSVPTAIGYAHSSAKYINNNNIYLQEFNQNYNLFNWNIGFNLGIGVKF